ncbi:MAG: tetraacyldisaccharide 4'-kinase, partial [Bacteroidales bacterium]|nr:tetraacyldisaccharide 4'-kinase [Bacteroidales bacterium]
MALQRKHLGLFLWPISFIYGLITDIRNALFNTGILKQVSFDLPIISVGNITVGGTGKTPHVECLVNILESEKIKCATLSRGYGRKTKGLIEAN